MSGPPFAKKQKIEETKMADPKPLPSQLGLLSFSDGLLRVVLDNLDVQSAGRLSGINQSFREKINNQYWFSRAQGIVKGVTEDNEDVDTACCGSDLAGVDWKKVVAFHSARSKSAFSFKDHLMDFVLMLGGRTAERSVQFMEETPLKPEFYVPSAGMHLSLPLDPGKLRALIDGGHCEQAPLGRGPDTIVDTNTRNCWRMMLGKDVVIGSQDWNAELTRAGYNADGMLYKIEEKLMPHLFGQGDVWAQPYSMLIYEKGSFFKPHRDTLRGPNHFGSLSILLPVMGDCDGGDFRLMHNSASSLRSKEVVTYSPPKAGEACRFVAFYTDVYHEVLPITSGYRVSLTYHLWAVPKLTVPAPIPTPASKLTRDDSAKDDSVQEMLMSIFKKVMEEHMDCASFRYAFALDHSYGALTLQPLNLRGRDKLSLEIFRNLASSIKIELERLCVETYPKPNDVTKYMELEVIIRDDDNYRHEAEGASKNTVWLNQEQLLSKNHEYVEYSYDTGNDGYTTGLQYEHACIIIKHKGFKLELEP